MKSKIRVVFYKVLYDLKQIKWCILLFIIYNIIIRGIFNAYCPFWIVIGLPCAGCGMTRAIYFILTGQFKRGINMNPVAPLWILVFVMFFWNRYIAVKKAKKVKYIIIIVLIITIITYLYRMLKYFPSYPPLVYNYECVLKKIWDIWKLKGTVHW